MYLPFSYFVIKIKSISFYILYFKHLKNNSQLDLYIRRVIVLQETIISKIQFCFDATTFQLLLNMNIYTHTHTYACIYNYSTRSKHNNAVFILNSVIPSAKKNKNKSTKTVKISNNLYNGVRVRFSTWNDVILKKQLFIAIGHIWTFRNCVESI